MKYQYSPNSKVSEALDFDDEENLAGIKCLSAMRTLMDCPLPDTLFPQLQSLFLPTLNFILTQPLDDCYEEAAGIFNLFLYK